MVFSSYVFLFIFLPSLLIIYFILPPKYRNTILIIYSLIFYAWNVTSYLFILLFSIFINWLAGILIHNCNTDKKRKIILVIVIFCNCLLLGYYKYADFFINNINFFFQKHYELLNVALPIGVSFFTFQGLSYVIDVYRKEGEYQRNPLNVALYIALFPQLVAGPIVRYDSIVKYLKHRKESMDKMVHGLQRFTLGLSKKIILADTFGIIADLAFESNNLNFSLAWIGALAYTFQIYFDFSGYSDMAIGLGEMFGFKFCENFDYPYTSTSVTEFWHRWHISLSSWFRDYIYIPLGGNRVKIIRHIFNMLIVWFLTGLWHGASWNFVLWGIYYFIWLVLEKYILKNFLTYIPKFIKWIGTFLVVIIGWVLFRSPDLISATHYLGTMFQFSLSSESVNTLLRLVSNYKLFWILGIITATPAIKQLYCFLKKHLYELKIFYVIKYLSLLLLFVLDCLYVIASSYNAFIYFQF